MRARRRLRQALLLSHPRREPSVSRLRSSAPCSPDELDLPPRRIREALTKLSSRLREANLSLETTERRLEEWIASA